MGKFIKTIIGVLLIPVALATAKAFYAEISGLSSYRNSLIVLERGVLAYLLVHVFVMRPVRLYVIAHELVHVVATWLCGGRVESFNVGKEGGAVVTSKSNVFIELSPYFVPFYTLLLGPVFLVMKAMGKTSGLNPLFLFLVGFTLAFHFVMTSEVLRMQQHDVAKSGLVLSLVVIFIFNLVLTTAVFCPFFEKVSFLEFIKEAWANSGEIYSDMFDRVVKLFR